MIGGNARDGHDEGCDGGTSDRDLLEWRRRGSGEQPDEEKWKPGGSVNEHDGNARVSVGSDVSAEDLRLSTAIGRVRFVMF